MTDAIMQERLDRAFEAGLHKRRYLASEMHTATDRAQRFLTGPPPQEFPPEITTHVRLHDGTWKTSTR